MDITIRQCGVAVKIVNLRYTDPHNHVSVEPFSAPKRWKIVPLLMILITIQSLSLACLDKEGW